MDQASRGAKALSSSDFPGAIKHYTQALLVNSRAVDYYIKRSTAYSRLKPSDGGPDVQSALRDAEFAVALAVDRGKRELILAAQMRRGVTLYQLERFGDAAFVFGFVKSRTGGQEDHDKPMDLQAAMSTKGPGGSGDKAKHQELIMWEMKARNRLAKLDEGDDRKAVNVKEYPDIKIPGEKELKSILEAQLQGSAVQSDKPSHNKDEATKKEISNNVGDTKQDTTQSAVTSTSTPVVSKVRHEWYQSTDRVVLTLYVKGVPKAETKVDFEEGAVSISFPIPSGTDFYFTLDPLYAPIDTSRSSFSVMSTKIEVMLFKSQPGQKWAALETTSTDVNKGDIAARNAAAAAPTATTSSRISAPMKPTPPASATPQESGPAYPTSSRHGAKDWDKLASSLTAKKKTKSSKKTEGPSSGDGDKSTKTDTADADGGSESDAASIDSDYGTGDPVDSFFKKLYANADPDTRRAMMKSYYESEGTALSTNWDEVGKGKVDARPP